MEDQAKNLDAQFDDSLVVLRQRIAAFEAAEAHYKQQIERLRQSEQLMKTAFITSPDAISITRLSDGRYIDVNESFEKISGYQYSELIGKTSLEIAIWANPAQRDQVVAQLTASGAVTNHEVKFRVKGGHVIVGLISARIINLNGERHVLTIARDISDWKQTEDELRQHNKKLELLNRIIAASASGAYPNEILEITCREMVENFAAQRVSALMFGKDKTTAVIAAESLIDDQLPTLDRIIPIDGNPMLQHLLHNKAPLLVPDIDADPRVKFMENRLTDLRVKSLLVVPLVVDDDVAGALEIDRAAQRQFSTSEVNLAWSVADQVSNAMGKAWLNEERTLLSTAINQAADIIIVTDDQGIILYANPAFEHITGYSTASAIGRMPFIIPTTEHEMSFYDDMWATIKNGQVWQGTLINKKRDGSTFTAKTTITPVKDETDKIINYVSTLVDVTREQELEKQYRQAQKMEAIGQLTAGIAHDFNNLLMAINGFAELMKFRLPKDSPFQDMASRIVASGESAADLIRQLLIFSRKQIIEPKVINLNDTVTEIDRMLRRIIGENIDLQTDLAPDLWLVKLDPTQVEQIIVNLAVNGRDAMPTGGQLTIETSNVQINANTSDLLRLHAGDYVVLTVADSGTGMDEATKRRIFEPFFTTKEHGKGTGLGLATVYGIVKQHGGDITVYSKLGEGSTFEIYLPRATTASIGEPAQPRPNKMSQGSETVLLVEDSSAVRELVTLTLTAQGYNIVKASNGEEALSLFKNYDGHIDLLLTDIVMPHMGGKELADRIIELDPNIKVIFTSGYTDDAISHYGMLNPEITFLQKPFSPGALNSKVREVLDRP